MPSPESTENKGALSEAVPNAPTTAVSVAVVIPTYNRGDRVLGVLERVFTCDPLPSEVWIHVDQSDGRLEPEIMRRFPSVNVISSGGRLGPGGGRHECLKRCRAPIAVSFDDDSYPVDSDFFRRIVKVFDAHDDAAIVGAMIWDRRQDEIAATESFIRKLEYTGCGYAIKLSAYRRVSGYVPRTVPYGIEETDLSLQLFAAGLKVYDAGVLRVFHDTELQHHSTPEIVSGVIANVAILAFLRYPIWLWGWAFLQLVSMVSFCFRMGRRKGILSGLVGIPSDCYRLRKYRAVLPSKAVVEFLRLRRLSRTGGL